MFLIIIYGQQQLHTHPTKIRWRHDEPRIVVFPQRTETTKFAIDFAWGQVARRRLESENGLRELYCDVNVTKCSV